MLTGLAIWFTVVTTWIFFIFMACLIPLVIFMAKVLMVAVGVWLLIRLLES